MRIPLSLSQVKAAFEWRLRYGWFARMVREAAMRQMLVFGPAERLTLGENCDLSGSTINVMSGTVTVGENTFAGHHVSLLAGSHDPAKRGVERYQDIPREGHDIVIGSGVWLASNTTIIGPCKIGDNAVVAAGAVVTTDVPADTIVAGIPARIVRSC